MHNNLSDLITKWILRQKIIHASFMHYNHHKGFKHIARKKRKPGRCKILSFVDISLAMLYGNWSFPTNSNKSEFKYFFIQMKRETLGHFKYICKFILIQPPRWLNEYCAQFPPISGHVFTWDARGLPGSTLLFAEIHDDVIKWKHFPRNWPFVRGIHRSPVNYPNKAQWRVALMLSLICAW